tara:strand:- start:1587 stop:1955 length:369 start_codon:yes stop_codon:yes gene_type:complete
MSKHYSILLVLNGFKDLGMKAMNYQMLLECYAKGVTISKDEAELLDIELYSQLESIKVSRTQGCIEVAPAYICRAALVHEGSLWITCLASVLDQLTPPSLGNKARGPKVLEDLIRYKYLVDN